MKSTIVLALGLALAGTFGFTSTSSATEASDTVEKPTEAKKKRTKKKPVVDPGTDSGGSADTLVNCWCSGGADGNGPAQCEASSCDDADSCCATAYGKGAEAEDQ